MDRDLLPVCEIVKHNVSVRERRKWYPFRTDGGYRDHSFSFEKPKTYLCSDDDDARVEAKILLYEYCIVSVARLREVLAEHLLGEDPSHRLKRSCNLAAMLSVVSVRQTKLRWDGMGLDGIHRSLRSLRCSTVRICQSEPERSKKDSAVDFNMHPSMFVR